jgi:hypothetical protein
VGEHTKELEPKTLFELVGGANGLLVEFAIVFQNQNYVYICDDDDDDES